MRLAPIILLLCVLFLPFCFHCSAQTLADVEFHGRWVDWPNQQFVQNEFTIPLTIHDNVNVANPSYPQLVEDMANQWNGASNSLFNIEIEKSNGLFVFSNTYDGTTADNAHTIAFDTENHIWPEDATDDSRAHLGITAFYHVGEACSDWFAPMYIEADIFLNPYDNIYDMYTETTSGETRYDLASIVLHEMGHFAGIRHHVTSGNFDVMHSTIETGQARRFLRPLDNFAITQLYQPGSDPQSSPLPCDQFDPTFQWLEGRVNDGTCQCDGLDVSCTCAARERVISEGAEQHLVFFVTGADQYQWTPTNNLYRLQFETIKAQVELMELVNSNDPALLPLHTAFSDFNREVGPLVEANFRCLRCPASIDLTVKQRHIAASIALINELIPHLKSPALIAELKLLRNNLDSTKGKPLREASIDYDLATLN